MKGEEGEGGREGKEKTGPVGGAGFQVKGVGQGLLLSPLVTHWEGKGGIPLSCWGGGGGNQGVGKGVCWWGSNVWGSCGVCGKEGKGCGGRGRREGGGGGEFMVCVSKVGFCLQLTTK